MAQLPLLAAEQQASSLKQPATRYFALYSVRLAVVTGGGQAPLGALPQSRPPALCCLTPPSLGGLRCQPVAEAEAGCQVPARRDHPDREVLFLRRGASHSHNVRRPIPGYRWPSMRNTRLLSMFKTVYVTHLVPGMEAQVVLQAVLGPATKLPLAYHYYAYDMITASMLGPLTLYVCCPWGPGQARGRRGRQKPALPRVRERDLTDGKPDRYAFLEFTLAAPPWGS